MSNQIACPQNEDEALRKCLKPNPSNEEIVKAIIHTYKSSQVSVVKELESYDDRNYLVLLNGEKYLAKVYNGVESMKYISSSDVVNSDKCLSPIHLYSFIFEHLNQAKFHVQTSSPLPVPGKDDPPHVSVHTFPVKSDSHSPTKLVLSLLRWVEGTTMSSSPTLPIETVADAGRYLGNVCKALDDLTSSNEDAKKAADRYHAWDGKHTLDLENFVHCIENETRRNLVKNVLNAFRTQLVESGDIPMFRTGILQGDFNDANIILNHEKNVSGVIDFGDTTLRYVMMTHWDKIRPALLVILRSPAMA